ncbi:FeoA family protein [Thalassotalea crassostreae]|uniref:FeoA family protein n=1 Tax=Thalassotalea crassostreae TaxID=1763536 RepID=UPI000837DFB9|nr:FeoA family protein [Thalassotalea crassostreae]
MTLAELQQSQRAKISYLPDNLDLTAQLMEQGFSLKSEVFMAQKAPFNGPIAVRLHGTKVSIDANIAKQIGIELV